MRYPDFINSNSSIGLPAPSFGCTTEPYYTALNHMMEVMREKGHLLYPGTNSFKDDGVGISTNPHDCGGELTAMYLDDGIDMLISCGGGELMCEVLDYIDFEAIKSAKPKWFMGYSDNTNFIFPQVTLCDTAGIYGPCASTFGMEPWHKSLHDFYSLLKGEEKTFSVYDKWEDIAFKSPEAPLETINATEDRIHVIYKDGELIKDARKSDITFQMKGRMLGGCMDCLINMIGSKYDNVKAFDEKYAADGIIWVLESCDLNVFSIRRAMWQMEHAGWFKHVNGFLIGRPANGESIGNLDRYDAILAVASKYNVPVIMDTDIGHRSPMIPVVMGAIGNIEVNGNDMKVTYSFE